MKTSILSILFLLIFNFSNAQTINVPSKLIVSEGEEQLDDVPRNGFSVELAGDEKDIIKAFEDFLENRNKDYDVKSFFKKISAENILVPAFSEKHINLNAQVRESNSKIVLWYWVNFGGEDYITTAKNPTEAAKCKQLLKEFAQSYFSNFIQNDISEVNEKMENSQDELEDKRDDIADLNKDQIKEKKKKDKLDKKRIKIESKIADLNADLAENKTEAEKINADVDLLSSKEKAAIAEKNDLESKIAEQEKTLNDLKSKLVNIKNF